MGEDRPLTTDQKGNLYLGQWDGDLYHGTGTLITKEGEILEG